ncbi:GTPase ObgE [Oceanispirochaeta sp.]|jgi:GTP-binding protein|uniref:GTPase ObgE n=1 Tax=Oceanispirochaeta sp. TaxID=2035350 RepID=UPI0026124A31|nr:GTPase ObgE [Oceanispirochaeta sp.]MDA3955326.1 GTPase ObgE [Oceanispirochaeta sp.]
MQGFIDETRLEVYSGDGGAGSVSFRREKYVPQGGQDGGDGGSGGNVVFQVKKNLKTLSHLNRKHIYRAETGHSGRGKRMHGKDGEPVIIAVPPGTLIRDYLTNDIIKDFTENSDGEEWSFLQGGNGGQGNWHFRTSRKQTPRFAQPGMPGEYAEIKLELNLIADIGFVGFPSVGKSSLLKAITNANPKVASYPFTTKIPNLGMLRLGEKDIVLADIPGIIEGASHGLGLGFKFLKHISRTAGLAFLIDLGEPDFEDTYSKLLVELKEYNPDLLEKQRLLVGTKMDLENSEENLKKLQDLYPEEHVIAVSIFSREGLDELKLAMLKMAT